MTKIHNSILYSTLINSSNQSIMTFKPSKALIMKKQNDKRLKHIQFLTTSISNVYETDYLPLLFEKNLTVLNDSELFRKAFIKNPKFALKISLCIPSRLRNDIPFMIEMYKITNYNEYIFGIIDNCDMILTLLEYDIKFFKYCSKSLYKNINFICKCIKKYPSIVLYNQIPRYIKNDYKMIKNVNQDINSINTFLKCTIKKGLLGWLRAYNNIKKLINNYIYNFSYYDIICNFISPIPKNLILQKCTGCKKCNHFETCLEYPNFDKRKQWNQLIKETANTIYGLQ